jgi:hypothetical protein
MAVSGLRGSIFSRRDGQALSQPWKARPFRPVAIAVGAPVEAAAASPDGLLAKVRELRGEWR